MLFWMGHGGWSWFAMSVSMILFWVLLILGAVLLFSALGRLREHPRPHAPWHAPPAPGPEQILGERFARGEIDEEEYRRRLAVLRSSGPSGPGPQP
ncbi:SHOCT domain-containing protein [Streptomyces orinoci]|uniref:SHOCT domain-containing protein n=1 Tax=Streptomyces orinoci TaxID=67339 RepID=A0ABV3JZ94_STRON|nr:SHOCT domain-containing protein [Streptomyces orinoci]